MKTNRIVVQLRSLIVAAGILPAIAAASTDSVILTSNPAPLLGVSVVWQPYFCVEGPPGYSCPGGEWTNLALPSLGVGEHGLVTTASSSFGFYLGNTLSGNTSISLSPFYRQDDASPPRDELIMSVVNRANSISTSGFGTATFNAVSGVDYYVLFDGMVRYGQTYDVAVSQTPLPASWLLLLSGLVFFRRYSARRGA